jgi:glycosyltransferase involved in cell wall biosynthesis
LGPVRVAHLITGLDIGGAESMLARLVGALSPSMVENTVVSLTAGGPLAESIAAGGVRVYELGMRPGRINVMGMYRASRLLGRIKPDVLQTWLYHADLTGLLAGALARVPAVVWNVRCAVLNPQDHPATLPLLQRALAWASRWPTAVVSNSAAGLRAHEQLGYRPRRWVIIPNGFDTERFKPLFSARPEFGRELGVSDDVPLVGLVARAHPMKDHTTFLEAAAIVARQRPDAQFVAVGRGIRESEAIRSLIDKLLLGSRIHLLPERRDPERVLAALDVAVSSSYSEAFPNVVGEAMACATPLVVTDVGDSARIVGGSGRVVRPRDPSALAHAIIELLEMPPDARRSLGLEGRARIASHYSLSAVASQYQQLYEDLAGRLQNQGHAACAG